MTKIPMGLYQRTHKFPSIIQKIGLTKIFFFFISDIMLENRVTIPKDLLINSYMITGVGYYPKVDGIFIKMQNGLCEYLQCRPDTPGELLDGYTAIEGLYPSMEDIICLSNNNLYFERTAYNVVEEKFKRTFGLPTKFLEHMSLVRLMQDLQKKLGM